MDLDRFTGLRYCARHMDCADLAILVQKELFGRDVMLAGKRPRPLTAQDQDAAIKDYCAELAHKVDTPQDGDVVLMTEPGANVAGHIGTYFFLSYTPYVLHTTAHMGESKFHKIKDLASMGLTVEGFYRWN